MLGLVEIFSILAIISTLDIFIELIHQHRLLVDPTGRLTKYPSLKKWINGSLNSIFYHDLIHSAKHSIYHIALSLFTISIGAFFAIIAFSSKLHSSLTTGIKISKYIPIDGYMGLSRYEVLFLQLEYSTILFLELHTHWNLFTALEFLGFFSSVLWFMTAFFVIGPFYTLFSVFLEKRFHSEAIFVLTATTFLIRVSATHVIFLVAYLRGFLRPCTRLSEKSLSHFSTTVHVFTAESSFNSIIPDTLRIPGHIFIVAKGSENLEDDACDALVLELSREVEYNHLLGKYSTMFFQDFLFASFIFIFLDAFIKRVKCEKLNEIAAFLLVEEFCTLSFKRYITLPLYLLKRFILERTPIYTFPPRICLAAAFTHAFASQKSILPSKAYGLLNEQENLCAWGEDILTSGK